MPDADIGTAPFERLSNFQERHFVFRGVPCASMEGLLQSLKFQNPETQRRVAMLHGVKAKWKGGKKKWWIDKTLYWQGESICRFSQEYKEFIREAFANMYSQCECFRKDLAETVGMNLTHKIGKQSENYTILTEIELTNVLTDLRDNS